MIIPNKKKAIGVILANYKPDGSMSHGGDVMPEPEAEHDEVNVQQEALKSHAADMIEAMHNKSAHDLMEALYAFLEQREIHEEQESPEEEAQEHSALEK